jgi:hypothetical protein
MAGMVAPLHPAITGNDDSRSFDPSSARGTHSRVFKRIGVVEVLLQADEEGEGEGPLSISSSYININSSCILHFPRTRV